MKASRSDEIIRNLNRLANDRSLSVISRNKVRDAARHISELCDRIEQVDEASPDNESDATSSG